MRGQAACACTVYPELMLNLQQDAEDQSTVASE